MASVSENLLAKKAFLRLRHLKDNVGCAFSYRRPFHDMPTRPELFLFSALASILKCGPKLNTLDKHHFPDSLTRLTVPHHF